MILNTALLCLALNVYHESRGEPILGQMAVAQVTMNRAKTPENVCDVVLAPKQFSWTTNLVSKTKKVRKAGLPTESEAWNRALLVAAATLTGTIPDLTDGSEFYHEISYKRTSWWKKKVTKTKTIGRHVFYTVRR